MKLVSKALRVPAYAIKAMQQVARLTFDRKLTRSYWPADARKNRARILFDLLWWFIRYGEVNQYYYVYGLDRRGVHRHDVLPYRQFRRIRNSRNLRRGRAYNYVCVLRDKFLFSQLVSSLGLATPKPYALLDAETVTWLDHDLRLPLANVLEHGAPLDAFCKPLDGIQGDGAFPLRLVGGHAWIRDREITIEQLRSRLQGGRYLLQQRIEQHPAMSALNSSSVNTVRLITFCNSGQAALFSAALRVGTVGHSVDNWAVGGLIVGIDPTSGALRNEGFFKPGYGGRVSKHPDSGIPFAGYAIPYFQAAVQLVTRLHEHLRGIHSIGWDVAIAPDGPVVIEGNDDWEGGIPMVLERDFRPRFLRMFERDRGAPQLAPRPAEVALAHD